MTSSQGSLRAPRSVQTSVANERGAAVDERLLREDVSMGGLPLSGWWVLIAIGVVGLLLLGIATAYLLLSPTKSAVTLPPRQVPVAPVPSANAQWTPAPPMTADALPMTMPMPQHPSTPPAPFVSPDATAWPTGRSSCHLRGVFELDFTVASFGKAGAYPV